MITVLVCAGVAASVIASLGRSIDNAAGRQDQAQARLLARAAADWSRNVLADDRMHTAADHLREPWAVRVPPTPVGDAEVSGEIQDWSGRFNLNNLAPDGRAAPEAVAAFERLLSTLDVGPVQAQRLGTALVDWIATPDEDDSPRRPGGAAQLPGLDRRAALAPRGPLAEIGELRNVPGFDDALIERLRELVVSVPAPSRINLNTAPPEVIFALVPGLDLNTARVLVAERDRSWYRNLADFTSRLPPGAEPPDASTVDVRSRHFLVTGRARYGNAMVRMEVLLDREQTWPEILWQRIL